MDAQPIIVVTGVSGSGKSTVGALLAEHLGGRFLDGDSLHPAANVAAMAAGQPLTDADRWPWLDAIGAWIDKQIQAGRTAVVACSALRRAYRDGLRAGRPGLRLVYLRGSAELIRSRLAGRTGHFFPASLLDSQLATLEEPTPDEGVLVLDIGPAPGQLVLEIEARLDRDTGRGAEHGPVPSGPA